MTGYKTIISQTEPPLTRLNSPGAGWTQGESWSLGDSPAIAIAINPGCGHFHEAVAPLVLEDTSSAVKEDNPVIRIYTFLN